MTSMLVKHVTSRIEPLSAEDIAQIKSSIAITSLNDVVLGLLCNSLDANASKITIDVYANRGICTVEDDGSGISSDEFGEHGGLLKCYYTSKTMDTGTHGRNGAFLAALCAMSLLYVVSKSAESSSTNSITAHQSKVITRSIPAPIQEELQHSGTGTKVVVRNLFGNMPVRVKQRALLDEGIEDAEWTSLVRAVVAHQLAWKQPVTIRIRNDMTGTVVNLQPRISRGQEVLGRAQTVTTTKLDFTLGLLTQASFITANSWQSWVPISARTSSLKIRGAISLDPRPTKQYQFIAISIRPLLHGNQNNELYDEINRLFTDSRFGVIEEDTPDEHERVRRSKDRRFKQDGVTNKLLKCSTKGVDRWPMFDLHIEMNAPIESLPSLRTNMTEVAELQSVLKVIAVMTTQWLAENGFKPRQKTLKTKSAAQVNAQTSSSQIALTPTTIGKSQSERLRKVSVPSNVVDNNATIGQSSFGPSQGKHTSPTNDKADSRTNRSSSIFQTWSRIKSGRPSIVPESIVKHKALTDVVISPQLQKNASSQLMAIEARSPTPDVVVVAEDDPDKDTWTTWQDPETRQLFALNPRSGLLVPAERPRSALGLSSNSGFSLDRASRPSTSSSLRLEVRAQGRSAKDQNSSWLKNLVEHWDNPVFQPAEQPLEQLSLDALENDHTGHCTHHHNQESSSLVQESRLSAHSLRKAKVISQLDNKFILIKMPVDGQTSNKNEKPSDDDLLVIVDQHAADERCKVEELLSQLCESTTTALPLRSNLGHEPRIRTSRLDKPITFETSAAETEMLRKHAGYFAKWGIIFDILSLQNTADTSKMTTKSKIIIQTLPPVILERCTAEPRLIIELLRFEAWQRGAKSKHFSQTTRPKLPEDRSAHDWLKEISDCPKGILEMINSRACRSAIMFNDVLAMEECEALLDKMADCAFPFQCAHGRPSMVPLVSMPTFDTLRGGLAGETGDVVRVGRPEGGEGRSAGSGDEDFVQAFRRWQKRD